MKALTTSDVFSALRIIKAAEISDELARVGTLVQRGGKVDLEELGLQLVFRCIERCANKEAEKAIYAFMGGLLERPAAEIANTDPLELFELITQYFAEYVKGEENEKRVKSFFGLLAKLTA